MNKLLTHTDSCKSCHYCEANCPKSALTISGEMNSKGYVTVEVNHELCITCGICFNVCPDYVFEIVEGGL